MLREVSEMAENPPPKINFDSNVICSRYYIAEKLLTWSKTTITHF
jgi:hypothetical protein